MDLTQLNEQQFAQLFSQVVKRLQEDPIENYVKASGFLDLTPTPAQEVILKIVFSKELDPHTLKNVRFEHRDEKGQLYFEDTQMTEYEIYEFLTDSKYDPKKIKEIKVNKINLICGRRSGKTLLSAIISIYCAISNNWKPFLKKTPYATVLIMSHSREFSDEVLEIIRTLIESSPMLRMLINKDKKNSASTMNLKTPWIINNTIQYSRVQIKVAAASSKTTRGVAACAILCDEIAFWNLDESMKETDVKIMKAVRPAMKQFREYGMLIKLSSPGIKQGVLYEEYKKGQEGELPNTYAIFKAPSWVMTPSEVVPSHEFVEEYLLDPEAFDQEYRANFAESLSSFIVPEYIDMAVVKKTSFLPPDPDIIKYTAAIDAAFKGDAFTFSVTAYHNGRIRQFLSKGWRGTKQQPISSFVIAEYVRTICKQFNIDEVAADQYAFQPLREIFGTYGVNLTEYTFTPAFKRKIYFNLKKLVHSQQIDLLDNEAQTRELKELIVEQSGGGQIKIGHPAGGNDDYADSLAVSAFLATEEVGQGTFDVVTGSAGQTYGVPTDLQGRAIRSAPSADMLAQSGHLSEDTFDNSSSFARDPITNRLMRIEDMEDELDTTGQFVF